MKEHTTRNVFITGGAGFLGSAFTERLLTLSEITKITVYDRNALIAERSRIKASDSRIALVAGDLKDLDLLTESMAGHDTVIHLASNADISLAARQPTIDFEEGTILTQNTLEAARINNVSRVLYASGSGVYGDCGETVLLEHSGSLLPISTYGASKLAGESLLSAYCHMFDLTGIAFRFANIVGSGQTHGIAMDFVEKLRRNQHELQILGNGMQTKSYIHSSDALDAVFLAHSHSSKKFDVFNVAGNDVISVNQIAQIAIQEVIGADAQVELKYAGGDRGWKGDVPTVLLNTDKIKSIGFSPKYSSEEAIRLAIRSMVEVHKSDLLR